MVRFARLHASAERHKCTVYYKGPNGTYVTVYSLRCDRRRSAEAIGETGGWERKVFVRAGAQGVCACGSARCLCVGFMGWVGGVVW